MKETVSDLSSWVFRQILYFKPVQKKHSLAKMSLSYIYVYNKGHFHQAITRKTSRKPTISPKEKTFKTNKRDVKVLSALICIGTLRHLILIT